MGLGFLWARQHGSWTSAHRSVIGEVHLQGTDTPFVCQQLFAEGGRRLRGALPWLGLQSVL